MQTQEQAQKPRLNNLSSYEMEADELLRWAVTEVRPKAQLAYEGKHM